MQADAFQQVYIAHQDLTAVAITDTTGTTLVVNVYNPGNENTLPTLQNKLIQVLEAKPYDTIIVAGDFNLHHPYWNPRGYNMHDARADELIEIMTELGLQLLIPPGTITYPRARTAIDLVWGNDRALRHIIKCQIAKYHDHGSDHLPIEIVLNLQPKQFPESISLKPYNYDKANWRLMKEKIATYLPNPIDPETAVPQEIDTYVEEVVTAIQKAISETTPRKRPSPFSKRWWNEELTKMRKEANKLRNMYLRTRSRVDRERWKEELEKYLSKVKQAKEETWKQFTATADNRTIYKVKSYMAGKPTPTYIPTLNNTAESNEEKTAHLTATFFPPPPPADLTDIADAQPETISPVACQARITMHQLQQAIEKLSPNKAPGPDEISNKVLKQNSAVLQHHLLALAQASFNTGHFPTIFKVTTTVVLRKPGKPDYTKPKAYRPIALENTIGKLLESIVAELLAYITESHGLLPKQHYGGRPGRTAEDAMTMLTENIHRAWKQRDIYTAIFMDVAGAFNNVHHQRLLDNLRKRRVPPFLITWIKSFLQDRTTRLFFNNSLSQSVETRAGVPQGSPLSPILYMYYNADVLEVSEQKVDSLGYIDDIAFGTSGETDESNIQKIQEVMERAEEWRIKHGVQFEPSKYVLVHFTRNTRRKTEAALTLRETTVSPTSEARYLGVIFDSKLNFKAHRAHATKRGTNLAIAMNGIAKATRGPHFKYTRQLFTTVVAPTTDHAAIVWYRPGKNGTQNTTQLTSLRTVQRLAMKAITGCFRTTPTDALEYETDLLPPHLRLKCKILQSLTRMQTLPPDHPVKRQLSNITHARTMPLTFPSTLEHLVRTFPEYATEPLETIIPYAIPPWWEPSIQVHLEPSKKDAMEHHDQNAPVHQADPNTLVIYTDGSGNKGHIGAATYCPVDKTTQQQYVGKASTHTVYAAELVAIQLALNALKKHRNKTKCIIYSDSQPAVKAIIKIRRQSGQSILTEIHKTAETIHTQRPQLQVTVIWIPGHKGIQGNEEADKAAKAAVNNQGMERTTSLLSSMKATRVMTIKARTKEEWKMEWISNQNQTALRLRAASKRPNFETGLKLYNRLNKRLQSAWITRLRTGHCSLNSYLQRMHIIENATCECG
jgi:ribonuclease HI